jgi:hypothetical protein
MRTRVTRRQVLGSATALSAGAALLGVSEATAGTPSDAVEATGGLIGVIARVRPPDGVILRSNGRKTVRFEADATFWRGQRPVGLRAFRRGDEVFAQGRWMGEVYLASHLGSTYRPIDGRLIERRGDALLLSTGRLYLTGDSQPLLPGQGHSKPLDQLAAGEQLTGLALWDPVKRRLIALQLGVRG